MIAGRRGALHWLARMSWCVNEFVQQKSKAKTANEESVRDTDEKLEKAYANAVRGVSVFHTPRVKSVSVQVTYNMAHSRLFNVAISRLHTLTSVLRVSRVHALCSNLRIYYAESRSEYDGAQSSV